MCAFTRMFTSMFMSMFAWSQVVDDLEAVAAERDEEIGRIAQSIEELSQIFKELAVLVIDQVGRPAGSGGWGGWLTRMGRPAVPAVPVAAAAAYHSGVPSIFPYKPQYQ